jgi:hypothetical protein
MMDLVAPAAFLNCVPAQLCTESNVPKSEKGTKGKTFLLLP